MNEAFDANTCAVCQAQVVGNRKMCKACAKFYNRNRQRKLDEMACQSGTDKCIEVGSDLVQVSNGAQWRFMCRKCRLVKCFLVHEANQSISVSDDSFTDSNEKSQQRESMAEAASEAIAMFEMTYFQWLASRDIVLLSNMVSATIVRFSASVPGFTDIPEPAQLKMCYDAAPTLSLLLVHLSPRVNNDSSFLSNLFTTLPTWRDQCNLSYQLSKLQPDRSETGLILSSVLTRNLLKVEENNTASIPRQQHFQQTLDFVVELL